MAFYRSRFYKSDTVGERKAKATKALEKLGKKGVFQPVSVQGPLAVTWWGKAWNRNLEGYADYSNRIGRGRSYVRSGSVIDLRVMEGGVEALVQGSRSQPYKIGIDIATLYAPSRKRLAEACAGKLESAEALLAGRFPEDLQGMLASEASGLFPNPKQIKFSCSCPDWASMCKHVAATLYGVGVRFDQDPALFFMLRGIKVEELVGDVVRKSADQLLKARGRGESTRLDLDNAGLGGLFGLELEGENPGVEKRAGRRAVKAVKTGTAKVSPVTLKLEGKPARTGKPGRPKRRTGDEKLSGERLLEEGREQLRHLAQMIADLKKDLTPLAVAKVKPKRR